MDNRVTKITLICSLLGMLALSAYIFGGRKNGVNLGFSAERKVYQSEQRNYSHQQGKAANKTVKVFITGEVRHPGVYDLSAGLRTSDAIKVAGGFTDAAKVEGVNLTKIVRDGMQIKVPALKKNEKKSTLDLGEKKQRERSFKRTGFASGNEGYLTPKGAFVEVVPMQEGAKICVNRASVRELIALPGIHEELARRIIAYREQHPILAKEDLLNVKGIRRSIYKKIKDKITL